MKIPVDLWSELVEWFKELTASASREYYHGGFRFSVSVNKKANKALKANIQVEEIENAS